MLFFLSIAASRQLAVETYVDRTYRTIEKDKNGQLSMTNVTLRPSIQFSGEETPTLTQLGKMHHQSHKQCVLATSVLTEVVTEIIA